MNKIEIINLISTVGVARIDNGKLLVNSSTSQFIRTLKDSNGEYLWKPSHNEEVPSTFAGYPIAVYRGYNEI